MRNLRWLSMIMVLAMLVAACASDDGGEETDAGAAEDAATTEGDAADVDDDAAGADDEGTETASGGDECALDEPVKVGVVVSQTGGAAVYGESQLNGIQLAADELNQSGGVTYEIIAEDDASEPAGGITAFEALINSEDVSVIIGPTLSNTAFSTNPVAQEAGVPVLGISNTATGVTEIGDYIFRDSLTEEQVIPQTIEESVEAFDLEQVAVMYGDDDAFTQSGYEVFDEALSDAGVEVTSTQTFAKGDTDFSAQLTEIRDTEPDALVVSALAEEAALILTQAADLGLDVPVIGGNGFNSPALIENAGEAAEGVVVGAAWNSASETPLTDDFIAAFEDATGGSPDQFAAQAHAGMNIVAAAVEQACSADPTDIRDALADLEPVETVLGEFSFTDDRDADHPAVVQVVEGGTFTVLGG